MRAHSFSKRSPRLARFALVLGLPVVLIGCRGLTNGPDEVAPNLPVWVDSVNSRPAPALEALPVMKQFEQFEYSAQALRDPFTVALSETAGNSGPSPNRDRRKQVLEDYPLDSLDMVGTIGNGRGLIGLVMVPEKVTYRVRPGDYMGQSDGRVTGVFEDRIELMELVSDGSGWQERPATISLDDE
jgi:type IV pilus assembly protein PilP